jgi:hypothetical protein
MSAETRAPMHDLDPTLKRLRAWRAEAQECVDAEVNAEVRRWHDCFECRDVLQLIDVLIACITERARGAWREERDAEPRDDGEGGAKRLGG